MKRSAIVYVENRESLLPLCSYLKEDDWQILSYDSTADYLKENGVEFKSERSLDVQTSGLTDSSAFIQRIMASNLGDLNRKLESKNNIFMICVNIEPHIIGRREMENNRRQASMIPYILSVIRAGITNYKNVLVLTDPEDYKEAIVQLRTDSVSPDFRLYLMAKALNLISAYDAAVSSSILKISPYSSEYMNYLMLPYKKKVLLSHGANAHQSSCLYTLLDSEGTLNGIIQIQGKDKSHHVVAEAAFAWGQVSELYRNLRTQMAVPSENRDGYKFTTQISPLTGTVFSIIVKNKLIVGAGISTNTLDSFNKALNYDDSAINQGTVACSAAIDETLAREIVKYDLSVVIAPGYTDAGRAVFADYPYLTLLQTSGFGTKEFDADYLDGGILVQSEDSQMFEKLMIVTQKRPNQTEINQLAVGMLMVMNSRSYAAIVMKDNAIAGIATGFGSRLKTLANVEYEVKQTYKKHHTEAELPVKLGDVLVSDSAIPLCEPVKNLIDGGISAIMQTGGLPEDNEFIKYCDEKGVSMIFTGITHTSY